MREPDTKWLEFFDTEVKSPPPPPVEPPKIVITHPSVLRPVIHPKKPPTRTPSVTHYDFEQAVINLHAGKPVTAQATSTADPFEPLFSSKTTERRKDSFDSLFTPNKATVKLVPLQTEKLQRPKLVSSTSKPTVNRAFVEEVEEFIL